MNDLRGTNPLKEEPEYTGNIVAAFVVVLIFGGLAVYAYQAGIWGSQPNQVVASNTVPAGPLASLPSAPPPPSDLLPAQTEDSAALTSPPATTEPPAKMARTRTPVTQPSAPISTQTPSEPAAPVENAPEQPAAVPDTDSATAPVQEAPSANPSEEQTAPAQ